MDIASLVIRVTSEGLTAAQQELNRLRANAEGASKKTGVMTKSLAALGKMAKYSAIALGGLASVAAVSLLKTADTMQTLNNQIRVATDGTEEYAIAQKELERISMGTYSSLESVGQLYASNERALSAMGKSQKDVLLFTENISKAMSVSGGSAQSQAAALTQLGQAMASGTLRGDEFNSIAEQAPVLMELLTESLKMTQGELRAFAATGGITAEIVYDAISGATEKLDGMMGQTVVTMSQAMTNVKTQWALLSDGLINGEGGIGDGLASSIQRVAVALQDARVWLDEFLSRAETIAFIESLADNVAASWAVIKDAIGSAVAAISEFLSKPETIETMSSIVGGLEMAWDNLGSVIKRTGEILKPVVDFFIENEEISIALAGGIAAVASAFVIYNAAVAIGAFVTGGFVAALALVTAPITLIVVAMTALVAAGIYVYRNWDEIKAKATEIWGAITTYISNKINEIKNYFSTNFPAMTAIVSGSIEIIKTLFIGGFNLIKNTVTTVLGVIKAVISGDFKAIPSIIGNGLKTAVSIVSGMMTNILNVIKEAGKKLFNIGRDFIQGFINGIKSVGSGVVSAASGMVGNAIAAVKKRQDSASPSKVTTKLGGDFSQGMANGIKKGAKAVKSEAQKMAEQAIETVKTSVASLQKEIALFGNDSPLASFNYDVGVGKFAGVPDSLLDKNRELITQKMRLIELDKQQAESVKLLAKARESIQERFTKLKTDQEASGKAVDGVMGELQAETAIGKIQADYERRIEVIRKHEELTTGLIGSEEAKRLAIYESAQKAKELLQIQGNEKLYSELSSITSKFFGEQSAAHRAMFAVEKYFALKRILVENKVALAKAWASASFPYNLPAVATVAAQTGLLATAVKGFKQGGYTGNMGASQVAGVVHGQEYVFDAQATKRIGVDNLNAMRRGDKVGGDVQVNIINNSSARVTASDDGQTITIEDVRNENKRSWTNLSNPNSFESKQVNRNVQAPRRR